MYVLKVPVAAIIFSDLKPKYFCYQIGWPKEKFMQSFTKLGE